MKRERRGDGIKKEKFRPLFFFISFSSLLFLLIPSPSFSIEAPSVKTSIWPKQATLGEEIFLFLRVSSPEGFEVDSPGRETNLFPFELKKIERLAPEVREGRIVETYKLTLTVFELGEVAVPAVPVDFSGRRGSGRIMSLPVKIRVVPVAAHPDKSDALRPIKGPVSLELPGIRQVLCGILAAILSVVLAVRIIRRRLRKRAGDLEGLKPPHERAMIELERLRRKDFLREGKVKEFYSELTDILRRYFSRVYGVETLELTTAEIMGALREKGISKTAMDKTGVIFGNADLVKFAKLIPERSLGEDLEKELVQVVELTKPEEP